MLSWKCYLASQDFSQQASFRGNRIFGFCLMVQMTLKQRPLEALRRWFHQTWTNYAPFLYLTVQTLCTPTSCRLEVAQLFCGVHGAACMIPILPTEKTDSRRSADVLQVPEVKEVSCGWAGSIWPLGACSRALTMYEAQEYRDFGTGLPRTVRAYTPSALAVGRTSLDSLYL